MRTITFYYLWIFIFAFVGCGIESHSQSREERSVNGEFTEINVSSGVDLVVRQGSPTEIIVEAESSILEKVKTEIKGSRLNVYIEGNVFSWFKTGSVKVYVTTDPIRKLSASGGSDLKSIGEITGDRLEISASGGADVEVSVKATSVYLRCSGGGDLSAEGEADYVEASASGGADLMARQLISKKVKASASGGADVEVYATEEIDATASGGADVDYYGGAKAKKISESGGGDVTGHGK
ncbi:head GIN domain-containing protein [Thermophagus sp. OGC60D27]|uniref:head GIN domain-containing protein n=1 Tax=Thermophagus sp. OGC60D27 TaxID=3458415 RepID=UPI0040380E7C